MRQQFGGDWTQNKLECIRRYLEAWTKVMMNQPFEKVYIDAFAGTGYRELQQDASTTDLLLPGLAEEESQTFLDGSARIALQVEPGFDRYIFVEKDQRKADKLEDLRKQYPDRAEKIHVQVTDANTYLQKICSRPGWGNFRAVLFLDPFGMEVTWNTIEAIAVTKAIDLWYLFPLGIAVNRMLTRDGDIPELWRERLTELFGTRDWYETFYRQRAITTLFGESEAVEKCGNFPLIREYLLDRLLMVFPGVAENPLTLCNSRGNPLFLLCFAVSNPKAKDTALRIAQHILKMR